MIELHSHSTCSDGVLTPTQLVQASARAGVKALALTDHDTMLGVVEATQAAILFGLEIVPGLELSTTHQGHSLHILGYYPNPGQLDASLTARQESRQERTERMVAKLAQLGVHITLPPIANPGRPHIARALVAAGYVATSQAAFDRYLREDRPAYEPYAPLSAPAGVKLLRDCGAVPVWAHPLLFRGGPTEQVLNELVQAGLQGLEVYRPEISHSQRERLCQLARRHSLVLTGGSDYHGTHQGEAHAIQLNMLNLSLDLLANLKQRAALN
ncbi:PHP domain-containing protein [Candidatus Cyanaurora vandensis]|uniref:PHP domain-containing protein n=1 Tax=Candidatus Cyanaurora vandensis TaxID=2714958 RepID=UPI00257E81EC|nr:PHP domain-containing protein [Candidatus Cyanaurora vandensis]